MLPFPKWREPDFATQYAGIDLMRSDSVQAHFHNIRVLSQVIGGGYHANRYRLLRCSHWYPDH